MIMRNLLRVSQSDELAASVVTAAVSRLSTFIRGYTVPPALTQS